MSLRPVVLWASRQPATKLRFASRDAAAATGLLTAPHGKIAFRFDRKARRLTLPDRTIYLDDYGWEVDERGNTVFRSLPGRGDDEP